MTLQSRIVTIIVAVAQIDREKILPDSTFDELGIDSMDALNIAYAVEGEFGISIPDKELRAIGNVRNVVDVVERLLPNSA